MILSNKCKKDFESQSKWYFKYLPSEEQNLIIYKWFNVSTNIALDMLNWGNGFDYAVTHPYRNEVYLSSRTAETYIKDFNEVLSLGIIKANAIYNQLN